MLYFVIEVEQAALLYKRFGNRNGRFKRNRVLIIVLNAHVVVVSPPLVNDEAARAIKHAVDDGRFIHRAASFRLEDRILFLVNLAGESKAAGQIAHCIQADTLAGHVLQHRCQCGLGGQRGVQRENRAREWICEDEAAIGGKCCTFSGNTTPARLWPWVTATAAAQAIGLVAFQHGQRGQIGYFYCLIGCIRFIGCLIGFFYFTAGRVSYGLDRVIVVSPI